MSTSLISDFIQRRVTNGYMIIDVDYIYIYKCKHKSNMSYSLVGKTLSRYRGGLEFEPYGFAF